jgi:uncharacterized protein YcnI
MPNEYLGMDRELRRPARAVTTQARTAKARPASIAARITFVALGAAALGAVMFAGPASAHVTVDPTQATQGDSANMTFRVYNENGAASTTKVEVYLPEATPVAEVYPLSIPDWAPTITMRTLSQPVTTHHGTQITEAVSVITWTPMPGKEIKPGQAQQFPIALGPLPDVDRLAFTVQQSYSDGTVVRSGAGSKETSPTITLVPATDAQQAGTGSGNDAANPQPATNNGTGGGTRTLSLAGAALAGGLILGMVISRARRSAADISDVLRHTPSTPRPDDPAVTVHTTSCAEPEESADPADSRVASAKTASAASNLRSSVEC